MSRNSKKTFEIRHKKRIEDTVKILYRILKERKLFGAYMQTHNPLTTDDKIIISRKIDSYENGHGMVIDVDGVDFTIRCKDEKERDFKRWVSNLYLISAYTNRKRDTTIPYSLSSNSIVNYICEDYFKRNKDKYSLKITRLQLETMFGVIYVFIGLSLMSLVIYYLIGFAGVITFMVLIAILSLYGILNLKLTQIY